MARMALKLGMIATTAAATLWLARATAPVAPAADAPAVAPAADATPTPDQLKFFDAEVRPILEANCLKCHGGEKTKGGLRLDSRDGALKGGDTSPAVVPGNPSASLLIDAINYHNDLRMPPKEKLSAEKIATLTQWVQRGAAWTPVMVRWQPPPPLAAGRQSRKSIGNFWSFKPVTQPAVPEVRNKAWVRNPIDAFVLAKLEEKGLSPAPPADKIALLRRAYYDLTGLPPTPAEVDEFVKDADPAAYEKRIDRLLDSPHYGEKWGRHWLDLVRYAETNSYERDNDKPNIWRYRDYVIKSFNADKAYDEFIREQWAGDEMPDAASNPDRYIATGFYHLGIWDDEPSDRDQARYDMLDDIVATTGQVVLGLTVDCARCHDHKLDPIPQADYYRLVSFFQNTNPFHNGGPTDEREIITSPDGKAEYDRRARERREQADAVQAKVTTIEKAFQAEYERQAKTAVDRPDIEDLSYKFYRDTWERLPDFSAIKFEDKGALPRGLFDLTPRTRDTAFGFVFEGTLVVPADGSYVFYLDSDDGSRLTVNGKTVIAYDGIHGINDEKNQEMGLKKGRLPIKLEYFQNNQGLGLKVAWSGPGFTRRMLSAVDAPPKQLVNGKPVVDFNALFNTEGVRIVGKEKFNEYRALRRNLDELRQPPPAERALSVSERGPDAPDTFILARGNASAPGARVEPGFLRVLNLPEPTIPKPKPGAKTSGRRTVLADWLVSKENPLTARVMANRIFQYHFGRGIVRSPNNFGLQGDKPTHPELLDWLAARFIAEGWHMKPLHRLIMTSNAYRMSSRAEPKALAADPRNELLWRFDMRRLTSEEIRDSILAVDGTLNPKMFGRSVYPLIPKEVMQGQSVPAKDGKLARPRRPPAEASTSSKSVRSPCRFSARSTRPSRTNRAPCAS